MNTEQQADLEAHRLNTLAVSGQLNAETQPIPPSGFFHFLLWEHNNQKRKDAAQASQASGGFGGDAGLLLFLWLLGAPLLLFLLIRSRKWGYALLAGTTVLYGMHTYAHAHTDSVLSGYLAFQLAFSLAYVPAALCISGSRWVALKFWPNAPTRLTLNSVVVCGVLSIYIWIFWVRVLEHYFGLSDHTQTYLAYGLPVLAAIPFSVLLYSWMQDRLNKNKKAAPVLLTVAAWLLGVGPFAFWGLVYWSTHTGR
ncbi:hypothetical protein [Ralstonia flatus]|uniref:Uncharacterized protein n=1 Tax=Ralstonia flatus TaxID=3058601 RepID=A0ABN9KGX7_9RALS|nr:hypothetical protein [Ralstonia sp. LMG 32965]MBN6209437.1 hypothetical protein [Ralstonia pickettii]CAJ0893454.1 hypothetical protein R77564_03714 [Ralstonia sp. LMG 32965]